MKRMWLTTTLVVCGLAQALFGGAVRADDGPTGAELLPKDTLLFFSLPDIPETKETFDKSLSGAMLREPELKPFLEDVKKKIEEFSDKLEDETGVSLSDLLEIPEGEFSFALVERPARKITPLLMIDFGENDETVETLLKKMHEALEGDIAEHSTEEIGDVKVHVFTLKDQPEGNPYKTIAYIKEDSYLVFSTEVAALKDVLDRWDGKNDDTLANDDTYKYIQERCKDESGDPTIVWFMSPIGLVQAGLNMAAEVNPQVGMAGIFLPMLGVDKLKGWGGASYGASGDFDSVSRAFLYTGEPAGILKVFQFPVADLAPPKWVPADTSMYLGGNWNVPLAYQAIEGMVDGFYGRGFTAKQLDKAANSGPGLHPKKDLLDLLDGKFHLVQKFEVSETDLPTQQMLLALGVKDVAKMKKTLAKVAKMDDAPFQTREFNGETIYEIDAGRGQTISVAVAGGHFVLTNDTGTLEGMMRTNPGAALVDLPAYQKIAKHFPAKMSLLSYSNSDAQMKALYQAMKRLDNEEFLDGISLQKLPDFEVLRKYLRPSGSYTIPDPKGKGALMVGFQLSDGDK